MSHNVIILEHPKDIAFSTIAQKSLVTGSILPSGLEVPKYGKWIIVDHIIINLNYLSDSTYINFPH